MDDQVRERLAQLLAAQGRAIIADPRRLEALLRDICPAQRREVTVLSGAAREQVPADLLSISQGTPIAVIISRLEKRLEDNLGMAPDASRWAVDTWAVALGVLPGSRLQAVPASTPPPPAGFVPAPPHRAGAANPAPAARPPVQQQPMAAAGTVPPAQAGQHGYAPPAQRPPANRTRSRLIIGLIVGAFVVTVAVLVVGAILSTRKPNSSSNDSGLVGGGSDGTFLPLPSATLAASRPSATLPAVAGVITVPGLPVTLSGTSRPDNIGCIPCDGQARFLPPGLSGIATGLGVGNAGEKSIAITMPAGTVSQLQVHASASDGGIWSFGFWVNHAPASGGLSCNIDPTSTTGQKDCSNSSATITLKEGDTLSLGIGNPGKPFTQGAFVVDWSIVLTPAGVPISLSGTTITAPTTASGSRTVVATQPPPQSSPAAALVQTLLTAPFGPNELPPQLSSPTARKGPVSDQQATFNAAGEVVVDVKGPDSQDSFYYLVFQTAGDAQRHFDTLASESTPGNFAYPVKCVTAAMTVGASEFGTSTCTALVDNVEVSGLSMIANTGRPGNNTNAAVLSRAGIAHLFQVQNGR